MLIFTPKPSLSLYRHAPRCFVYQHVSPSCVPYSFVGQVVTLRPIGNRPVASGVENPLSQITDAKRHYPKRNPRKNTPIASGFVTSFVKQRTGKSAMMPTIGCSATRCRSEQRREREGAISDRPQNHRPRPTSRKIQAQYANNPANRQVSGLELTSST
jgi:hypothetical protein